METRNFARLHQWMLIKKKLPVFGLVLFEIGCSSLRFVTKFSKKVKWFTNLVCDENPKLRPIFPRWQCSLRLVWKYYLFLLQLLKCRNAPMVSDLDFVLNLSLIQISQMSWNWATKDIKNNNKKQREILNDLVKKLWSFIFCLLNFTSFESYII